MKASTQYNDFIGTAAADISDHKNLTAFLLSRGVDTKRFDPIGVDFYSGYSNFFSGAIICVDIEKSTLMKKHIVSISFDEEITRDEFFDLFKRFNVVISSRFRDLGNSAIDEELSF